MDKEIKTKIESIVKAAGQVAGALHNNDIISARIQAKSLRDLTFDLTHLLGIKNIKGDK